MSLFNKINDTFKEVCEQMFNGTSKIARVLIQKSRLTGQCVHCPGPWTQSARWLKVLHINNMLNTAHYKDKLNNETKALTPEAVLSVFKCDYSPSSTAMI